MRKGGEWVSAPSSSVPLLHASVGLPAHRLPVLTQGRQGRVGVPSLQSWHRFEVLPPREPALALSSDSHCTSLTIASPAAPPPCNWCSGFLS